MSNESSNSSDGSDSDDSVKVREKLKKIKKKIKKELERKAERQLKKKLKKEKRKLKKAKKLKEKYVTPPEDIPDKIDTVEKTSNIPISLMESSNAMKPMTKEEWDKRQSVVRKVLDEDSGRYRLIKGDGEILEEIVPLKKHKEINKQATKVDGEYFQAVLHRKG